MIEIEKLRCPICKGKLILNTGLKCPDCVIEYPLVEGIPILLPDLNAVNMEQDVQKEKDFYENMFANLSGFEDGHCIVYGHEKIYEFMEEIERGTLIEVGCGGGHHSVNLSKRGFKITAIDLSLNGLRAAKKLADHEGEKIVFLCGDIKRLPFEDKEFDICFCSLVLHHFIGFKELLQELARVTKRYFVAFEVNALDPMTYFRFNILNPLFGLKNISANQRAIFPESLKSVLLQNGFRTTNIKYEDMHDYLGKAPESKEAKILSAYQKIMKLFPERYSANKFLLRAER